MGGLGIALLLGLVMLGGRKPLPKYTMEVGPIRVRKPAPAKKAAAPKKAAAKAKPKPVQATVPASIRDTAAAAVQSAAKPGVHPVPNAAAARKLAQPLADYIRNNRKKYDRARVATWQAFAGIAADGIYGPKTAKALRAFGAKSVVG
jgi:hypothetical protein